ncbi:MAG: IS66 family transposase [Akkermansiaceae bacterium]
MSDNEQDKDEIIALLREENRLLKEKVDYLIRIIHGRSSEKIDPGQLELLFDPEAAKKPFAADSAALEDEDAAAASTDESAAEHLDLPARKRVLRKPRLPGNIPTVKTVLIPDEVRANPGAYRRVGEKRSEKLDVTPTRYTRLVTVRPTFVEKNQPIPRWITAPAPSALLEGSILTPSLLAHVTTAKYCDHLPLYRQEKIMARRHGINIARNTLCHWIDFAAETLQPLYKLIATKLRESDRINVDETPVTYLQKEAPGSKKGYFWIYHSNTAGILYDWRTGRDHRCLDNILAGRENTFSGILQCDGYSAYETWAAKRPGIILAGCWAHARRKFHEALPHSPGAAIIIKIIQKLYRAEHRYREWITRCQHPPESIVHYRRRHLKPLLRSLRKELLTLRLQHLPQSKMGKALSYALNQWRKLCIAIKHSPALDNNVAENAVRPLKLGAKNWLFIGRDDTGWRSAVIYTLIENVRREGKDPYAYLKWVFERIPHMSNQENLEALLPKTWLEQQSNSQSEEAHSERLSA